MISNLLAESTCQPYYYVGPRKDGQSLIHAKKATPDDFSESEIKRLVEEATFERVRPISKSERQLIKNEINSTLKSPLSDETAKLEASTALSLIGDIEIGPKIRAFNTRVPSPIPWDYLPPQNVGQGYSELVEKGFHIRKSYEIDIELDCCIVEITITKKTFRDIYKSKKRQIKRYLNSDEDTLYLNPNGKRVILYAPNATTEANDLHNLGIGTATSLDALKSEIKRALSY